jgi:hypothetical protein
MVSANPTAGAKRAPFADRIDRRHQDDLAIRAVARYPSSQVVAIHHWQGYTGEHHIGP